MFKIVLYKLDKTTIDVIKTTIETFFQKMPTSLTHDILVTADEETLFQQFSHIHIDILFLLPEHEEIVAFFKEMNQCMQVVYVSSTSLPVTVPNDTLQKPFTAAKLKSIFERKLKSFCNSLLTFTYESAGKTHEIKKSAILYLQGRDNDTLLHKKDGSIAGCPKHISEIIPYCPRPDFAFASSTIAINMTHLKELIQDLAILSDDTTIPIDPEYRSSLLSEFIPQDEWLDEDVE